LQIRRLFLILVLLVSACGSDEDGSKEGTGAATASSGASSGAQAAATGGGSGGMGGGVSSTGGIPGAGGSATGTGGATGGTVGATGGWPGSGGGPEQGGAPESGGQGNYCVELGPTVGPCTGFGCGATQVCLRQETPEWTAWYCADASSCQDGCASCACVTCPDSYECVEESLDVITCRGM
jgi:hypothetical protein